MEEGRELWVEVPPSAAPLEFELTVDGRPTLVPVDQDASPRWRVVQVFDRLLSDPVTFRNSALLLAERASALASLGPIEIALLDYAVQPSLPATRESAAVADALSWLRIRESPEDAISGLRLSFRDAVQRGVAPTALRELAVDAARQEIELIQAHLDGLLIWAADSRPGPKLMILASSGFDLDPNGFYRAVLEQHGVELESPLPDSALPSATDVARALSVFGWTVVAFSPSGASDALLATVPPRDDEIVAEESFEKPEGPAATVDLGGLLRRLRPDEEAPELQEVPLRLDPRTALDALALETGGRVASDSLQLDRAIAGLGRRLKTTLPEGLGSEGQVQISVRLPEAGRDELVARRWVSGRTPALLSAARARSLLGLGADTGDLQVAAIVQEDPGSGPRLTVEASVPEGIDEIRATVGVGTPDDRLEIRQLPLDGQRTGRSIRWELPLPEIQDRDEPAVVIVVDTPGSGEWGGVFASYVRGAAATDAAEAPPSLLQEAEVVRLLAPDSGLLLGRARFQAAVFEQRVARVDFFLDGEREAVRRTAPFSADLDLGPLPQTRRVEVIAFDAAGAEVGRDTLVVNSGAGSVSVRLRTPAVDPESDGSVRFVGALDVVAEVEVPRDTPVERVVFYWRDDELATLFRPPFRHTIDVDADDPQGFVRVVAYATDGSATEDVLFINSPGPSDRLQVTLVELYTVVTDDKGRPVRDLSRSDFRLFEEGDEQSIASFSNAEDLPLTLGLAIDSSASMFVKLPDVQLAANQFLRSLLTSRDRGFVVGFGDEPRLSRTTTSDLRQLVDGINALEPEGKTAIWKSIVFSLVQLQGVPGKKALIVYSDGADEDPDFSYRLARRFARQVGVPIYVILSNNEIVRTAGQGLHVRGFLNRLTELVSEVGGRVYTARIGEDLEAVYNEISDELRSQYVLGYYAEESDQPQWRRIRVDIAQPGLVARTAAGHYR